MSASIKIVCKKKVLKNGLFPIYLRITIDRKSNFYSTPYSCTLKEWNEAQGEFTTKFTNHLNFNKSLRKLKDEAADTITLLEMKYGRYNIILFDKYYKLKDKKGLSFVTFFEKEIKVYTESNQVNYAKSMGNALKALNQFKKGLNKYYFENIDYEFLSDFENFLRKRGANDGGIAAYMRNVRTIFNKAISYKMVHPQFYPFREFKISKFKKREIRKALTESELKSLMDFDISTLPTATNARFLYIFSFYARGMNFTDIAELKWSDINDLQFTYTRNKTDVFIKVKLPDLPIIEEIFKFYKTYRLYDTPFVFPILTKSSDQYTAAELYARKHSVRCYYNLQLKEIFKACNIEKDITFYTARHTFATTAMRKNININIIKQALGHQRISTTESYLDDFLDSKVDQAITNMF